MRTSTSSSTALAVAQRRDRANRIAENRDRIDAADDAALIAALREANHIDPDVVTDALNAAGVPK